MKRKHVINFILLAVLCVVVVTKYFFYDFWRLGQNGMYPTIADSGRFLCERRPYENVSEIQRGDIVVFKAEWKDGKQYDFIWRVVGLPRDTIVIQDKNVIINGEELKRERIGVEQGLFIYRESNGGTEYSVAYLINRPSEKKYDGTYEVPENHVFVLGDNRDDALDSRAVGPVAFEKIFARKL